MKWSGRKPKLTSAQAAELRRMVALRRADPARYGHYTDKWLKLHFGISGGALYRYANNEVKKVA